MSATTTTTEKTQVTSRNPFAAARVQAEQREHEQAAKAARLAEERRLEREKREKERAGQFQRDAYSWAMNFFEAVAKAATQKKWKPAAIDQARAYAEALVRKSDVPLPTIDPGMAKVIQSKFAYGIALDSSRRAVIPENFFNGQRQDWFPALYELKLTQVS